MVEVTYKGKKYNIQKQYLGNLKGKERQAQIKSIIEGTKRPETSFKTKRSKWVKMYEDKYGHKITDKEFLYKNIISKTGAEKIIMRGKGAYYSGGSRPNQTPFSWALSRLASVIMGGNARKVDKDIWDKYNKIDKKKKTKK